MPNYTDKRREGGHMSAIHITTEGSPPHSNSSCHSRGGERKCQTRHGERRKYERGKGGEMVGTATGTGQAGM